jgi:hypothetical protein
MVIMWHSDAVVVVISIVNTASTAADDGTTCAA